MNFDAVVIGAGLGGGAAAAVLAERGKSVLLLEQGDPIASRDAPRDHLSPLGSPIAGFDAPPSRVRRLHAGDKPWSLPGAVGGGTLVWGMQAWRFYPDDFRMASRYGVPEGSSLTDWPLSYAELEPWYGRAEVELGVAGDYTPYAARSDSYPLPPVGRGPVGDWLASGAAASGWQTFSPPLAVNSAPYNGRAACVRCSECIGFSCPIDAKNGAQNTFVPRAMATGLCTLRTRAQATRMLTDQRGYVTGVEYVTSGHRHSVSSRIVVVAGGAIETARLLLLSEIGNEFDQVGRHLQGHTYSVVLGLLPPEVPNPNRGPGPSVATSQFNHGNPGIIGGAMMANDFVKTPVAFWRSCLPPDVPRWGHAAKDAMRQLYLRTVDVRAPVQEVPTPENRVTLHPTLRDRAGLPVAVINGVVHAETRRTEAFMQERLRDWLEASGAERTWVPAGHPRDLSDWFHQAGTCRMSDDPCHGVVDSSGRVHGHDNLFVMDGSVHVTNGGFNPALTILALALRAAEGAASWL